MSSVTRTVIRAVSLYLVNNLMRRKENSPEDEGDKTELLAFLRSRRSGILRALALLALLRSWTLALSAISHSQHSSVLSAVAVLAFSGSAFLHSVFHNTVY